MIVENRAGAAGVIGSDAVAKSPRDGSVLLLASSTFVTAAATHAQPPYDPLTAFAPAGTPAALVERFNPEITAIAASAEHAPVLEPDGTLAEAIAPAVFAERIRDELAQWKRICAEHKIVAE